MNTLDYTDDPENYDEESNLISCCDAIVDLDLMMCPICKEHL